MEEKEEVINGEKKLEVSSEVESKVEDSSVNSVKDKKDDASNDEKKKRKKNIIITIVIIFVVFIVLGLLMFFIISANDKKDNNTVKSNVTKEEKKSPYRLSGNSLENFDLYFLQLENNQKNKVYSPLSIKYALAMLQEGAGGNSKVQINALIGDYKSKKYVNSKNMSLANALFIKDAYKDVVDSKYSEILKNKYNAEVIYDPFVNPNNLNNWVSNKTFNLIDDLFDDSINEQTFIITNALAIDMEWNKFIQATTDTWKDSYTVVYSHEKFSDFISVIDGDVYSSVKFNDGAINAKSVEIGAAINNYNIVNELGEENIRQTITTEYQKWLQTGGCTEGALDVNTYVDQYIKEIDSNYKRVDASTDFMLYDDENVKAFVKDLKEYDGTTLQYVGIMPKDVSLDNYIKDIDSKDVNNVINNLKEIKAENFKDGVVTRINGYIPLFKFDYELELLDDLKKLGITDVFDIKKSNLSGIVGNNTAFISSASHKANIEFSNEGIKAAAATQMGGAGATSCGFEYLYDVPVEEIDLTFDKPYLFIIMDKDTGEVWFTGTVYEPTVNPVREGYIQ